MEADRMRSVVEVVVRSCAVAVVSGGARKMMLRAMGAVMTTEWRGKKKRRAGPDPEDPVA